MTNDITTGHTAGVIFYGQNISSEAQIAILRIRGGRPVVKLRRNTSASSEGIHATPPRSG
ncbi:MAG TPA: hypothetical protein VGS62_04660 [Streptosporangiaceae bacterium]|nr:hypothetical protein [Streptosporangiaceae bacterium]